MKQLWQKKWEGKRMSSNTNKQNQARSWYLVVTKPKSEFKAQENLRRQDYETYLPLVIYL